MSVRVNLLPREFEERSRQRRMVGVGVLVVAAWAALLAFVLLGQLGAVNDAKDERDTAQAEVNRLQAEVQSLAAFQDLADRLNATNAILTTAMDEEVSWAQILNNLALSVPTTASLTTFDGALNEGAPAANEVFTENDAADVGFLNVSGYSTERFAPGVESVLLRFGQVDSFFQQYLSNAAQAEIGDVGVTNFDAEVRLDEDNRTGRYADGLPEVTR
ncbi:Type IV pilus biogenesis protein PilN [Euzebya pacifica]|mgnify:CR=1 FL=1|uniref:Type IV pilus biogenesis protein PilN n=1 Tax=Euzebya pacifica TaxID=1608957 RepID=A0A346XW65_9ACTN|nr:hypothetical protein [Euzebya pacifica]AXV06462.1 Type IV pilus biogenesis protein PilN [Euzebya pacifica]